jgi:hypothetical protein
MIGITQRRTDWEPAVHDTGVPTTTLYYLKKCRMHRSKIVSPSAERRGANLASAELLHYHQSSGKQDLSLPEFMSNF